MKMELKTGLWNRYILMDAQVYLGKNGCIVNFIIEDVKKKGIISIVPIVGQNIEREEMTDKSVVV